jgi:hypothetical protein
MLIFDIYLRLFKLQKAHLHKLIKISAFLCLLISPNFIILPKHHIGDNTWILIALPLIPELDGIIFI